MALFSKPIEEIKLLYITTALDGEEGDLSWADAEYKTILDLGIPEENIYEYKIGNRGIDLSDYDAIYVLGGNTFYLMDKIREFKFEETIKDAIKNNIPYIGSSAGSIILGTTLKPAEIFGDIPTSESPSYEGLGIIDAAIIPHINKRKEAYEAWLKTWDKKSIILYDGDGVIL